MHIRDSTQSADNTEHIDLWGIYQCSSECPGQNFSNEETEERKLTTQQFL